MTSEIAIVAISGGLGTLLLWFFQSTLADLKRRLDRMEQGLSALLSELKAGNVTSTNNTHEIAMLRTRMHEFSNDIMTMRAKINACKHCNTPS